jgi:hypothetical protein
MSIVFMAFLPGQLSKRPPGRSMKRLNVVGSMSMSTATSRRVSPGWDVLVDHGGGEHDADGPREARHHLKRLDPLDSLLTPQLHVPLPRLVEAEVPDSAVVLPLYEQLGSLVPERTRQ